LTRRANQGHNSIIQNFVDAMALRRSGCCGAIAGKSPSDN